jgi:flagellar export protein FliJ
MAKKFSFRLEPLLNLRAHKVKEAKEELVKVVHQRTTKEQEISNQNEYFNTLHKSKSGRVNVTELQAKFHHKNFVKEEIVKLDGQREQLLEIEDLRRRKLTEAMKEQKILDKLKEKQKIAHSAETEKDAVKIMDEIAISRHGIKNDLRIDL